MAKVWVKGFTKDDGTKVKGHYRDTPAKFANKKLEASMANRMRLGDKDAFEKSKGTFMRSGGAVGVNYTKKLYGQFVGEKSERARHALRLIKRYGKI
jgi:hypothetical protein